MGNIVLTKEKRNEILHETRLSVMEMASTLTNMGVDPDEYAKLMQEAMVTNPALFEQGLDEKSIFRAVRQCCRDGLLPDGREAVLIPFKGVLTYMPMRDGLMRLMREATGAIIQSGVVYEGDEVTVSTVTGEDDVITVVCTDPFPKKERQIIGAWCYIKMEGHRGVLHRMDRTDLDRAKAASAVKDGGPWKIWSKAMCEKAVVKSACNRLRSYIPRNHSLRDTLDHDRDAIVVEAEPAAPQEVLEAPKPDEPKPAPKVNAAKKAPNRPAPAKKAAPKPAAKAPATPAAKKPAAKPADTMLPEESGADFLQSGPLDDSVDDSLDDSVDDSDWNVEPYEEDAP